jgi:hypothetical protein
MKTIFESWLEAIVNFDKYRVAYKSDYVTDVEIQQLDRLNNPIYSVVLKEAFPTTVSAIGFDSAAENAVQKLVVSMAFTDYRYSSVDHAAKSATYEKTVLEKVKLK